MKFAFIVGIPHKKKTIHTNALVWPKTQNNIHSESGFDSRRSTPFASGSSSRTPGSGGSLKIGRRSGERSKSPFRSFRWKRGSSRNIELDYDEEGNKLVARKRVNLLSLYGVVSKQILLMG